MINPHPGLPEFTYIKPASLAEACQFLSKHADEAIPFSGGTDCFVRIRDKVLKPKYLVDIKNLDGTLNLTFDPQKGLTIGAGVPMNHVIQHPDVRKHYPLITKAAQSVASYQLRNRATIVGNICNASPAGDTIGACLVHQGRLTIHGPDGTRFEELRNFFKGPGKTTLKPGEIVTNIQLPLPPKNSYGTYAKLGRNKISDLSIVGVTILGYPDANAKSGYRFHIALASVGPTPLIPAEAEIFLAETALSEEMIRKAAHLTMEVATPIDDVRGSAVYRKAMVRNLTTASLTEVWEKLKS
jgi:carbon-monoxide dehydrogenase medium subunit